LRWYSYLVGYLIVTIEGEFPEKVINMALIRGIFLWDIIQVADKKIMLKIRLHGFRPLARIARKCRCHISIYERKGIPFQFKKIKKRKTLALGSMLFFLSLYILCSFVWVIEVKGTEDLTVSEVKELAADFGLKPGAVIKKLDLDKLEVEMQDNHPKLAWVGISIQGTKVTIEIAEKVLIPETEEHKYAHLIAREPGIIEEMLVLKGTPQVKEGDQIERGQILISGWVYPEMHLNDDGTYTPMGNPELVRAKGIVRARVKHIIKKSCPIKESKIIQTGEKSEQVILKIGKKQIVLKGPQTTPFQYYQKETTLKPLLNWRNIQVPVELITNTFIEQKRLNNNYGHEGAYQEAIKRAENNLRAILPQDAKVLNQSVKLLSTESKEIVEVEVIWDCLENVAVPMLIHDGNIGDP
jgi:similar to stage IV sporulation protein